MLIYLRDDALHLILRRGVEVHRFVLQRERLVRRHVVLVLGGHAHAALNAHAAALGAVLILRWHGWWSTEGRCGAVVAIDERMARLLAQATLELRLVQAAIIG